MRLLQDDSHATSDRLAASLIPPSHSTHLASFDVPTLSRAARGGVTETREFAVCRTQDDCWTAYRGRVYDMTPFMEYHPGGVKYIMSAAGKDGTKVRSRNSKSPAFPSDFPDYRLFYALTQRGSKTGSVAQRHVACRPLFPSFARHLASLNPKPST